MKKQYFNRETGLIRSQDPERMTPQQRANWILIQAVLNAEYQRGLEDGRQEAKAAKQPDDIPEATQSVLDMLTRPYNPEEFRKN